MSSATVPGQYPMIDTIFDTPLFSLNTTCSRPKRANIAICVIMLDQMCFGVILKGTVPRDFLPLVFFSKQLLLAPVGK
jgi:hypothetical protein